MNNLDEWVLSDLDKKRSAGALAPLRVHTQSAERQSGHVSLTSGRWNDGSERDCRRLLEAVQINYVTWSAFMTATWRIRQQLWSPAYSFGRNGGARWFMADHFARATCWIRKHRWSISFSHANDYGCEIWRTISMDVCANNMNHSL